MSLATQQRNGVPARAVDHESDVMESATPAVLDIQARAEIDVQIATAQRYPRKPSVSLAQAKSLATLDPQIAQGCFYSLNRGGKAIMGPSVRLAEIVAGTWKNLRVSARIVDEGDRYVTAQAVCMDMETNFGVTIEVRRRITGKDGRRYNDDMIGTTSNAAVSIAFRNAVFRVVPRAMVDLVYRDAVDCAKGAIGSLSEDRTSWMAFFAGLRISEARVFAALEIQGIEDITLNHLMIIKGYQNAVDQGETTWADLFPEFKPIASVERKPGESKAAHLGRALKENAVDPRQPGEDG